MKRIIKESERFRGLFNQLPLFLKRRITLDDLEWIELDCLTTPTEVQSRSFFEYEYEIPAANKNGSSQFEYTLGSETYTGFKTFAVKVVPLSSNSSVVPLTKELRAIALQV
jgi:hypothetical protein